MKTKEKKPSKIKTFFEEFKKFITRGNVLDMSVGVIVGGAFTGIVNGLSNYILKPLINALLAVLLPGEGLEGALTFLQKVTTTTTDENGVVTEVVDLANSIYIDWGAFVSSIINFLLIAFVLFTIVRIMNRFAEAREDALEAFKSTEKKAIRAYRKQGLTKAEAIEKYKEDLRVEAEKKAEQERVAAEAAAKAAAEAEAKAMANTKLLEEIRDLLAKK